MNNIIDPIYFKVLWEISNEKKYDLRKALWSISTDQLNCKSWIIKEISNIPLEESIVQLYGGWFGFPLIDLLEKNLKLKLVENIDLDAYALKKFRKYCFLKNKKYVATLGDIQETQTKYHENADLVINTSSEHMPDLPVLIKNKKYKKTCVFVLQSNNMDYLEEHTNCCTSEDHLIEKSGLSHILYKGKKLMENGFERYMVIGMNA